MSFGNAQGALATEVAAAAFPLLAPSGSAAVPSYSFSGDPDSGMAWDTDGIYFSYGGTYRVRLGSSGQCQVPSTGTFEFGSTTVGTTSDVLLHRDAAAVLALKNGTTAQTFRVYGTTTGPQYLALVHDGTAGYVKTNGSCPLYFGTVDTVRWRIDNTIAGGLISQANYRFSHGTSALATDATEGFFHINTCAGAPTGVPASIPTAQAPMVIDTTNDRLYFYYDDGGGAAWHYISRTA